jgi:cytochrome c oxidase subunit 3
MSGEASKPIAKEVLWGGGRSPFSVSYGKMMMWFFLVSDALTFGGLLTAYGFARHAYTGTWPIGEEVFHHMPFMGDSHMPLIYVAIMTFILIVSSVTMVLAVEAGHRMDKRGVVKWLAWTVVGGAIFVGSQAWEWSHFIHGSHFGGVTLEDGSYAWTEAHADKDGHYKLEALVVKRAGSKYKEGDKIEGEKAIAIYEKIEAEEPSRIVHGANLITNEYGPPQFGGFFFFITGFHGFHVFSGVVINLIVLIMVMKGMMHKRGHYEMVEKAGLYWHFVDLVWVFVFTFFYLV